MGAFGSHHTTRVRSGRSHDPQRRIELITTHYCPGVLGGDTCEGYIFITARVFLEGTPVMGTYGFHYCPGVLGGDTYDGYIVHRFHELRVISSQSYYVTHPPSVHDFDDDYQGDVQGDDQEDKLSAAMMHLTRAITQHFSTMTNNRLRTSPNTRNQVFIQDGRVDIQSKNVGYAGSGSRNFGRVAGNLSSYKGVMAKTIFDALRAS
ncbi:hypothetical protein Tco_1032729 [Tanacetum coccineum]|uniref:Uncharacterized protein n=1 Tax=Tanacetum coccineum TaxID=301880 RepID=A0ABQ5GDQ7_9ASTR